MAKFDNSYRTLPSEFFSEVMPEKVSAPKLIILNHNLVDYFDLSIDGEHELFFSGNKLLPGSQPIALAYAGHQFGHFNPHLGDGRACLLGELLTKENNRFDIQLKGSGRTPYSRNGDGKSPLGPALREYLVSEAMFALGIPTTRGLAVVSTGEDVYREETLTGGIVTRIASSHIRIGTFEYFTSRQDFENLKILADYSINRHDKQLENEKDKYFLFFKNVAHKQIQLIADWMSVGFIHGVMNTDNMAISGETIDFGPCAFMDQYNSDQVYSYIDRRARYAFSNQPKIAAWNLSCLASCLIHIPGLNKEIFEKQINEFFSQIDELFQQAYYARFLSKLGLEEDNEFSRQLVDDFLSQLHQSNFDFTNSFIDLQSDHLDISKEWLNNWKSLNPNEDLMKQVNPRIIPRNHQIENVIESAYTGNYDPFYKLEMTLQKPFQPNEEFSHPPKPEQMIQNTFCGT